MTFLEKYVINYRNKGECYDLLVFMNGGSIIMKERKIKLPEVTDAKKFVSAASKCDFDVDVFYNRVIIDAKSLLGVLSLDLSRELTVQYGGEDLQFENFLNHYTTA